LSLAVKVIDFSTCSTASTVCSLPIGASSTGIILIVTVAILLSTSLSFALKVNESLVAVSELLVYVAVVPSKVTVPSVG